MVNGEKRIVYIIQSETEPSRFYTGITSDVEARLEWHNNGPCGYSVDHRPWSLVVEMKFANDTAARRFERYLKSGSGHAFARKRSW